MPPKSKERHNEIKNASYHRIRQTPDGRLRQLCEDAKRRAKKKGLDYDLNYKNLSIPKYCPLLWIEIRLDGKKEPWSPSLDRIDPSKGYTIDNVWVVSWRANQIKLNATLEEYEMIAKNWRLALEQKRLHGAIHSTGPSVAA